MIKKIYNYPELTDLMIKKSHVYSHLIIPCIYKITNINTNEFYIGKTRDFFIRIKQHCRDDKLLIDRKIKYHGIDKFIFEILIDFRFRKPEYKINGLNYLIFYEQCLIKQMNPNYNEYKI